MHDVTSLDQGEDIGWVEDKLLVDGVTGLSKSAEGHQIDLWDRVGYSPLDSHLGWVALSLRKRREVVELISEAKTRSLDHVGVDGPHIGDLGVIATYVLALAVDWAEFLAIAVAHSRGIALCFRDGKA